MNLAELIAQFRSDVQDPVLPGPGVSDDDDSLWKHTEIIRYADLAQREFARRVELFVDRTSFVPAVTAADPFVVLDWRIIRVESAKLASTNAPLKLLTTAQFEANGNRPDDYGSATVTSTWEDLTGTPYVALTDQEQGKLRLVPTPVDSDTLRLVVVRAPLKELKDYSVALEVLDPVHQDALLDYMKHRAYMKQDADAFDADAAAKNLTAFDDKVTDIRRQRRLIVKPTGAVQYGGY